jgi:putative transposase
VSQKTQGVLTGPLKERLVQLVQQQCLEKGWDILELAVQPDHLHLFGRVWPSDAAAEVVGRTERMYFLPLTARVQTDLE